MKSKFEYEDRSWIVFAIIAVVIVAIGLWALVGNDGGQSAVDWRAQRDSALLAADEAKLETASARERIAIAESLSVARQRTADSLAVRAAVLEASVDSARSRADKASGEARHAGRALREHLANDTHAADSATRDLVAVETHWWERTEHELRTGLDSAEQRALVERQRADSLAASGETFRAAAWRADSALASERSASLQLASVLRVADKKCSVWPGLPCVSRKKAAIGGAVVGTVAGVLIARQFTRTRTIHDTRVETRVRCVNVFHPDLAVSCP
jgi:hypothetical protein